jgi:ADP-ribosylglycohydrolase
LISKAERIQGGFWGLLIGDALGVPYEFHHADLIPPASLIDFIPPDGFDRTYKDVPPGTWSDDGAQALCLLESLLTCGKLELNDFAQRLVEWYQKGRWAVDGIVFDVGIQTAEALRAYQKRTPAYQSGFVRPDGKGNGALMRVLPLALWHRGTDAELIEDAHLQSLVTHGHPTNQVCCALYCVWVRRVLEGKPIDEAYRDAVETLRAYYSRDSEHHRELEWTIRPDDEPVTQGSGYVVDSFRCTRIAITKPTYEEVVKTAISFGNDTDTNAAIAGGLAGVRDGIAGIPKRWLDQLRGKALAEPLLEKLLEWNS